MRGKSNTHCKINRLPKLFSSFLYMYSGKEWEPVFCLPAFAKVQQQIVLFALGKELREQLEQRLQGIQDVGFHCCLLMYSDCMDGEAKKLFRKFIFSRLKQFQGTWLGRKSAWLCLGTVRAHQNHHTVTLSSRKRRTRTEPDPRAEPSWKRPCSQISCVRSKRFPQSSPSKSTPFFAPHSKSNTISFALTKLFALTESGLNLENIWQNQSSVRKLRKLLLPATSVAPIG
ncbi:uncharacterized protein LOC115485546 [Serinus canaria]|uniref:uncharacterized protein LOC115485546 n=1 Tax=Serinus canaria TaxID=9135 RepID=UPI0021CCE2F0|nr:uncharacterized protein LOC115485546 [Serinus canaria]